MVKITETTVYAKTENENEYDQILEATQAT